MNSKQSFKLQLTCSDYYQLTQETKHHNRPYKRRYHERWDSCNPNYYHHLNNLHYFILN